MSPERVLKINQNNIYVSWGILILLLSVTLLLARASLQLEELIPLIKWKNEVDKDLSLIKYQLRINDVTINN